MLSLGLKRNIGMSQKIWGGRFREETDALVDKFNASIGFDHRMFEQDIQGSMAHCRMLAAKGIITEEEASQIIEALGEIKREISRGEVPMDPANEDIHSLVEAALVEKIGDRRGKVAYGAEPERPGGIGCEAVRQGQDCESP